MSDLDQRIRNSLSRLGAPDEASRAAVWESVVARRRRRRQRRAAVIAVPVVAVLGVVVAFSGVRGGDGGRTDVATGSEDEQGPVGAEARPGEPVVTVQGRDLGPLQVTSTPLQPAEPDGSLAHTVTLMNTGGTVVHLNDFRSGAFIGEREVLVATEGCGYGGVELGQVSPGCQLDYRPVTISPGEQHRFTVTLWHSLAGMNPPTAQRYRWQLELQLGDEPFDHPDQVGDEGQLMLEYDLSGSEPSADLPAVEEGPAPPGPLAGELGPSGGVLWDGTEMQSTPETLYQSQPDGSTVVFDAVEGAGYYVGAERQEDVLCITLNVSGRAGAVSLACDIPAYRHHDEVAVHSAAYSAEVDINGERTRIAFGITYLEAARVTATGTANSGTGTETAMPFWMHRFFALPIPPDATEISLLDADGEELTRVPLTTP